MWKLFFVNELMLRWSLNSTQLYSTLLYSTTVFGTLKKFVLWIQSMNCVACHVCNVYTWSPNLVLFINIDKVFNKKRNERCSAQISFNSDPNQLELKHEWGSKKTPDFIFLEPQIEFGNVWSVKCGCEMVSNYKHASMYHHDPCS